MQKSTELKPKSIDKLIQIDDHKYPINSDDKERLTEVLENEIQFLLSRKQKEKQKKDRIKRLEQEYEKNRLLRLQSLQNKNIHSEEVKHKALKEKMDKNKKNLDHIKKIKEKSQLQNHESLEKSLERRRQFYSQELSKSSIGHSGNTSQSRNNQPKKSVNSLHSTFMKNSNQAEMSDLQMQRIASKLQRAKSNYNHQKEDWLRSLHEKNQQTHESIQSRLRSQSSAMEREAVSKVCGKNEHILQAHHKVKNMTEKYLSDRRKQQKNKEQKLKQNISYNHNENREKYQNLQQKLSKIYTQQSTMGTQRSNESHRHRQKVYLNHLMLQQKNKEKNQQILERHLEISNKNKIIKEKKDKILQTIKKINPQE